MFLFLTWFPGSSTLNVTLICSNFTAEVIGYIHLYFISPVAYSYIVTIFLKYILPTIRLQLDKFL